MIELTNLETGETLNYVAEPMKQNGRYSVQMTLPAEGRWAWAMTLDPLLQEGELAVLTVQPASSVSGSAVALTAGASPSSGVSSPSSSRYFALVAIALAAVGGLGLLLIEWRNRRAPVTQ
jgi:hypothetical protein